MELLPSTLFVFVSVAALAAGVLAAPIASGCFWALAMLVRSEIVVAVPFVLFDAWTRAGRSALWKTAAPISACLATMLIFNVAGGGTPLLLTTSGGVNLWLGNNPQPTA